MNFVTIFASIGFVFVILYVFWFISKKYKNMKDNGTTNEISVNYMNNIGARCPDYYININNDENVNSCKNSYNLDQNIDDEGGSNVSSGTCSNVQCYSDYANKIVEFDVIDNWGSMTDDERKKAIKTNVNGTTDRCSWIKCCGVSVGSSNTYQPWLEIQDYCDAVTSIN